MKSIMIISSAKYPNGDAGAVRQHVFAKLFKDNGYDVLITGLGESTNFKYKSYEGIRYISLRKNKSTLLSRVGNIILHKRRLKKILNENKFNEIMIVNIPILSVLYIKKYAKKKNIKLLHDSVEWYSPEQFKLKKFSPSYITKELYNRVLIDSQFKVICISRFLEEHFKSRDINTCRIPVIMDINKVKTKKVFNNDKLVLVYAGAIGKKDYIKEIIYGLDRLPIELLEKIELRIFGATNDDLKTKIVIEESVIKKMCNSVKCFGRVPRDIVLKNLEEANFTVLLRASEQRYSKAGFPTKVVESLSTKTPVILNITSDLGEYLIDGYNSMFVDDCTPESFCETIRKALMLTEDEQNKMRENARITAEKYFDYRKYKDII